MNEWIIQVLRHEGSVLIWPLSLIVLRIHNKQYLMSPAVASNANCSRTDTMISSCTAFCN